jgi:hypothetical protein
MIGQDRFAERAQEVLAAPPRQIPRLSAEGLGMTNRDLEVKHT